MSSIVKKLKVLDLFSGSGGLSTGFKQAGFDIIAANDSWQIALESFRHSHRSTKLIKGDITTEDIRERIINFVGNKIDVIIGGPPCQAYSLAGLRIPHDPRGKLFEAYLQLVEKLQPHFFVMENVAGIISMRHFKEDVSERIMRKVCGKIEKRRTPKGKVSIDKLNHENGKYLITVPELIRIKFKDINYELKWELLNAADYGVPQTRKRVFFIGTRLKKNIDFPDKSHSKNPSGNLRRWITLRQAIGRLPFTPPLQNGDMVYPLKNKTSFIYMSRNRRRGWNEPSYTIQAGARHIPLHPGSPPMKKVGNDEWIFGKGFKRRLSVMECARIQTFPKRYRFFGSMVAKYRQIGNAVPPLLARKIGDKIRQMLE